VSSQELQPKYSYKFTLKARKTGADGINEPSEAEVQAYIFEALGVKDSPTTENQR
jgi:hypothetical protein